MSQTNRTRRCCECRAGEHANYDDDVRFVTVRDPDERNRFVLRGYVCGEHRVAFTDDGYRLTEEV
jgi:hypothetical protein